ncbi:MAG TPA: hypothetical protein VK507_07780 [Iamia sp.]|nr:hypothetical protein [Iamia sp.]
MTEPVSPPATDPRPGLDRPVRVGAVVIVAAAMVVHAAWWWLEGLDWGSDFQGTYDGLHDDLADPWFWSLEVGCVAVVVFIGVGALVALTRRRRRGALVVLAAAVVALVQMASIRLLLPSRAESNLPSAASGDCCTSPSGEIDVVDAAFLRALALAVLMVVIGAVVASRLRGRPS